MRAATALNAGCGTALGHAPVEGGKAIGRGKGVGSGWESKNEIEQRGGVRDAYTLMRGAVGGAPSRKLLLKWIELRSV